MAGLARFAGMLNFAPFSIGSSQTIASRSPLFFGLTTADSSITGPFFSHTALSALATRFSGAMTGTGSSSRRRCPKGRRPPERPCPPQPSRRPARRHVRHAGRRPRWPRARWRVPVPANNRGCRPQEPGRAARAERSFHVSDKRQRPEAIGGQLVDWVGHEDVGGTACTFSRGVPTKNSANWLAGMSAGKYGGIDDA